MLIKKICFLLVCFAYAATSQAQFVNDYVVAADKYFAAGDYYSAAQYYEKSLASGKSRTGQQTFQPYAVSAVSGSKVTATSTSRQKIIYNLAESYRMLHYHVKALPYYEEASRFDPKEYPLAIFYYATTLRALEKYDEAETAFKSFLGSYTIQDEYADKAQRELANLSFIKQQLNRTDLKAYTLTKDNGLNAGGGSYAPLWVNGQTIWFTSTRPFGPDKNHDNANRIYQADFSTGMAANVSLTALPQPKDMQQGVSAITPDGQKVFLTRWTVAREKRSASIYSSSLNGTTWSEPVAVNALNMAGSNSQQPFVMPDGKHILFSSDRPGGQGGYDLWMAALDPSGNAVTPVNMGLVINTRFDEQAPTYQEASKMLIFSSNGRVGMGGYDFYYSKGTPDNFSEPRNFGYPVNSIKDDIYFAGKGSANNPLQNVIISSDRDAACCLELFSLNKEKPLKQVTGIVLACSTRLPLSGVKVVIMDTIANKVVAEKITDASGSYAFTLEEFMPLKATGSITGYFNNSIRFLGPDDRETVMYVNPELCLNLIPEKAIKVDNVYYDFNKASLQEASFISLDDLVTLLNDNPTMQIELSAHTDSKGTDEYNINLSQARAQSVVDYLISKGIDRDRLIARGYGEAMPVAPNTNADGSDNPEGRQLNRRTEFKVLKN
ncbi:MAG: OmpA family protein [Ferruginibacter sp.]